MAIDLHELSPDQIQKGMACKSLDEFMEFAKSQGFDLDKKEAQAIFEEMYATELTDEDLDAVAGGASWYEDDCTEDECATYTTGHPRGIRKRH